MAFNISDFRQNGLSRGGQRPSLFMVSLTLPPAVGQPAGFQQKFSFTCSATQLPASTIGQVEVPYFGRKIKLAGDRTFSDWQVNVFCDEDFLVRDTLEYWSNQINQHVGNLQMVDNNDYKTDGDVTMYSKTGAGPLKAYVYRGVWPMEVSATELNWDAVNQVMTFTSTFSVDWFEPLTSASGVSIDTGSPGNSFLAVPA